jgi:hypothetical protein
MGHQGKRLEYSPPKSVVFSNIIWFFFYSLLQPCHPCLKAAPSTSHWIRSIRPVLPTLVLCFMLPRSTIGSTHGIPQSKSTTLYSKTAVFYFSAGCLTLLCRVTTMRSMFMGTRFSQPVNHFITSAVTGTSHLALVASVLISTDLISQYIIYRLLWGVRSKLL